MIIVLAERKFGRMVRNALEVKNKDPR